MGMGDALMVRRRLAHGEMEAVGRRLLVEAAHIPLAVVVEAGHVQRLVVEVVQLMLVVRPTLVARLTVRPMLVVAELLPGSPRRRT